MKNTIIVGFILLITACSPTPQGSIYWINSYQVDCTGVGPMKCMLVQKGEAIIEGDWQNFYSQIEGFEYEPGFIYKLRVMEEEKENVPADASSIKYTLMEVLEQRQDDKILLNGYWQVLKIKGTVVKLPKIQGAGVLPNIRIDLGKMHLSGIDGCNKLNGKIASIETDAIEFGPLAATMKMCPDMTIADAFNSAMNKVKKYRIDNEKLLFLAEDGNELLEFKKGTEARILLNDIWVVEQLEGEMVMDKSNAPSLEIHTSDMEAMGSDGCNNFMGKIQKLNNEELVFGPLAGTRKMCPDMTVPDKFNKALTRVRKYHITGLKLKLMDEKEKVVLLLKKVD